ncbi:PD40 domain-containing protein [Bacteroides helcogenes]|uniref:WD40-like beta Propeller containing protein n=1 Tax=Bacteroides helcogenes (strain ATCC 35417 / DSM 20613 / JCM 6297 / CCUG 15421 / P 36-108) TaxID=693979 RepID=E6STC8_BACT6|nr:PD40 domain-containing protein [Bacteroides helcogenes]ADV42259.1 WD40-like beta Propeller containing protein [Bacteroides helcogenes P 36-108]MDY5237287.1 PD40 domain-containing protein [Bacteroides helcogenes]
MKKIIVCILLGLWLASCGDSVTSPEIVDEWPDIYPDYIGVTIPATIAPMNFDCIDGEYDGIDVSVVGGKTGKIHLNDKIISFPRDAWHKLLDENRGDSLLFVVSVKQGGKWKQYRPFPMYVSPYPIDYGIVYRKIAPGYEVYSKMGIYERNLSTFEERPLLENTMVTGMCLNCHAFNKTNPDHLSLHIRGRNAATLMQVEGKCELLNTKTDSTLSACVYPYWHPGGKYIAYSVNNTRQAFHCAKEERIEVLDLASDILVYHPETHELLRSPLLQKKEAFETFPVFSPDGRKLYFCSAEAKPIPERYKEIRYSLCSIEFNSQDGTFGEQVDTLVNAEVVKKSISFPRPSYDGKYIMFTLSDYGNFSIWHKEADLWLLNLQDGSMRPMKNVNSDDTESFHNWSSNSRWFVFGSRRGDGLYTRLYLACIDENGQTGKPFLLPQENSWEYYDRSLYSYNVPEFTSEPVKLEGRRIERGIVSDKRIGIKVR